MSRQKPPTARRFSFFTLQDGSERVQVIISPNLWEAHRQLLREASALIVYGRVTVQGRAVTLNAVRLIDIPVVVHRTRPSHHSSG